ncbi:hypothetical protein V6R21_24345 [Limibacter armeniacum]|uniref:hypothetical protein n=1 Tax=Limibacter armeniacum TaxID=466084 RepID=UPI002FE6B80E
MTTSKSLLILLFILTTQSINAQSPTFFATGGFPFIGTYQNNGFVPDKSFQPTVINSRFKKNMPLHTISKDGKMLQLSIEQVNTENIGDIGIDAPIQYIDQKSPLLEWSSTIKIKSFAPTIAPVSPQIEAEIRALISAQYDVIQQKVKQKMSTSDTSQSWQKHWNLVLETIQQARGNIQLEGFQIQEELDKVFVLVNKSIFIYSKKEGHITYNPFDILIAYDSLSSTEAIPILYFKIEGNPDLFILCDAFDGYDGSYRFILNAATGKPAIYSTTI